MRRGLHPAAQTARARAAFIELCGERETRRRERHIRRLPTKRWKGQLLYALECQAEFGNGPHVQYVPEAMLWALISLGGWRCPFHA